MKAVGLVPGAGHHKQKVKRGGMAYLAKDREGKEVFKGCYFFSSLLT